MSNTGTALLQRAVAWHNQGRLPDAAQAYRQLLAAEPRNADALHLLGVALAQMGSVEEAITLLRAAVAARPDSAMVHGNLGKALIVAERHEEAAAAYGRIIELQPNALEAHVHRGIALARTQRHEEALACFDRAIALRPEHPDAYYNRGNSLGALGRHAEALESFERTLALQPQYVLARWNRALLKLLHGEWLEGWALYETRFELDAARDLVHQLAQSRWTGREALAGKTILLWAERGLGDTIQFARYVTRVHNLGANVILEVQPALKALLATQFPGVRVIAHGEDDDAAFDYHCPLLSLPLAFGTEVSTVPRDRSYLTVASSAVEHWASRLPQTQTLKVGIAWQGNPAAEKNWARGRSIPLTEFGALAHEPRVTLISLQTGVGARQLDTVDFRDRVVSFDGTLDAGPDAFLDTAAVMMSLDLVITADTSIAHLAGALGVPVWVALHTTSEWRWLLDRRDSPWYPTARLFRQKSPGDWSGVFEEMIGALRAQTLLRIADTQYRGGQAAAAVDNLRRAIDLDPHDTVARANLGVVLEQTGDSAGAAQCYRAILALDPRNAVVQFNLGNVLLQSGARDAALACYQRAVELRPDFALAWCNCAGVLLDLQNPAEALACSDRALALDAKLPAAWYTRGVALNELQRTEEALRSCDRAIELRPLYPEAIYARAAVLRYRGDSAGAVGGFRAALRLNPNLDAARLGAVVAEIPLLPATVEEVAASRQRFAAALQDLETDLERRPCDDALQLVGAIQPFYLAYQEEDQRELLERYGRMCVALMDQWRRKVPIAAAASARRPTGKVRVAIVTAHIASHSVYEAITRGWLKHLDRERFCVDVFHTGGAVLAENNEVRGMVDHFDTGRRGLAEWAGAIAARSPDAILYPEIGIDQTTLQLASLRLARAQLTSWGHPITTGLPTIDYYLSADAFEPHGAATHYSERLIQLPGLGTYFEPETVPISAERANGVARDMGPVACDTGPLLICAGTPFKYAPQHDSVLVEIARRLPGCQFHLFSYRDGVLSRRLLDRLKRAFTEARLDAETHLVLRPWGAPDEFQALLRSADLMLDTIGFSGFNTVMHALACDLPVVGYRGRFLRGRLGSGILEHLGLHELVAENPAQFVETVVSLARDSQARARARDKLRRQLPRAYRDRAAITGLERVLLDVVNRAPGERETVTSIG